MCQRKPEARADLGRGVKGFFSGGFAVFRGGALLIRDSTLRRLAIVPVVVSLVLYVGAAGALVFFAGDLLGLIWARPDAGAALWIWRILLPFVVLSVLVGLSLAFSTVVEVVGGPFFDRMAIRVLESRGIHTAPSGMVPGIADLSRSLVFLCASVTLWGLGLLPGVGLPFALAGSLVSNLGLASGAINPALMATGVGLRARIGYVIHSFAALAGLGFVIGASLWIPLAGLVAIPCAVVGAALLYADAQDELASTCAGVLDARACPNG